MSIDSRAKDNGKAFGDWDLNEMLGQGSNGKTAVFKMTRSNRTFQETCAMKIVNIVEQKGRYEDLSDSMKEDYDQYRDRLCDNAENELSLMNKLRGSGKVVNYHDYRFVDWKDDRAFGTDLLIRMDCYESLGDIKNRKKITEEEILKIGSQISASLVSCHHLGIIHRDIKPDNIFKNSFGNYLLGDFGISKMLENASNTETRTGTESYAAPEQFMGNYDNQVDIYSLGLSLYELANNNKLPFAKTAFVEPDEIQKRLSGASLPMPVGVSVRCSKVILKACEYKPENRYKTAEEMRKAFDELILEKDKKGFDVLKYKKEIADEQYIEANNLRKKHDYIKAVSIYKKLYSANNTMAGVQLACIYYRGNESINKNYTEAKRIFEELSKTCNPISNTYLAHMYYFGNGCEIDKEKSKKIFKGSFEDLMQLCNENDSDAQYIYGIMLLHGIVVEKSPMDGYDFIKKSSDNGDEEAKASLALCHLNGKGCIKDQKKAYSVLQSCDLDLNDKACLALGEMYFYGYGVKKDYKEAIMWYKKAADLNNPAAQCFIGYMYSNGKGVKQDFKQAFEWYKKGALSGNASAQYNLGMLYKNGRGVEKNSLFARKLFELSSKQGNAEARKMI